jgi:hypothetical protein
VPKGRVIQIAPKLHTSCAGGPPFPWSWRAHELGNAGGPPSHLSLRVSITLSFRTHSIKKS